MGVHVAHIYLRATSRAVHITLIRFISRLPSGKETLTE